MRNQITVVPAGERSSGFRIIELHNMTSFYAKKTVGNVTADGKYSVMDNIESKALNDYLEANPEVKVVVKAVQ